MTNAPATMLIAGVEYVTTAQAAVELGVDEDVIYQWKSRGLIVEEARVKGRPIYRLDKLWDVERDTRNKTRRRSSAASGRGDVRIRASGIPVSTASNRR